ncbi:putative Transmembrane protein [Quillaja saponaria]|uniref:Transmembrane protein n=1 Tax=Quillaja saponaria TaxID=32244 RepID=A0AAD7VDW9_QUISA|nr:putative Transmembrane protein [Quillaja saponaria]
MALFEAAHVLMVTMVVSLFYVTQIVAQKLEIAPTAALQTGAGFALPVTGAALFCSSVLVSLLAFVLQ